MSKGSIQRKQTREQKLAFDRNFDRIFRKQPPKKKKGK